MFLFFTITNLVLGSQYRDTVKSSGSSSSPKNNGRSKSPGVSDIPANAVDPNINEGSLNPKSLVSSNNPESSTQSSNLEDPGNFKTTKTLENSISFGNSVGSRKLGLSDDIRGPTGFQSSNGFKDSETQANPPQRYNFEATFRPSSNVGVSNNINNVTNTRIAGNATNVNQVSNATNFIHINNIGNSGLNRAATNTAVITFPRQRTGSSGSNSINLGSAGSAGSAGVNIGSGGSTGINIGNSGNGGFVPGPRPYANNNVHSNNSNSIHINTHINVNNSIHNNFNNNVNNNINNRTSNSSGSASSIHSGIRNITYNNNGGNFSSPISPMPPMSLTPSRPPISVRTSRPSISTASISSITSRAPSISPVSPSLSYPASTTISTAYQHQQHQQYQQQQQQQPLGNLNPSEFPALGSVVRNGRHTSNNTNSSHVNNTQASNVNNDSSPNSLNSNSNNNNHFIRNNTTNNGYSIHNSNVSRNSQINQNNFHTQGGPNFVPSYSPSTPNSNSTTNFVSPLIVQGVQNNVDSLGQAALDSFQELAKPLTSGPVDALGISNPMPLPSTDDEKETPTGSIPTETQEETKQFEQVAPGEWKNTTGPEEPMTDIERFGMKGLLSLLRMENNDISAVAIGSDLTALAPNTRSPPLPFDLNPSATIIPGVVNNSNGTNRSVIDPALVIGPKTNDYSISKTFTLDWHGPFSTGANFAAMTFLNHPITPTIAQPPFTTPSSYKAIPVLNRMENSVPHYPVQFLFYIFYTMPREERQLSAATELQVRGWRYNMQLRLWLKLDPNSKPPVEFPNSSIMQGTFIFFDPFDWKEVKKEATLNRDTFKS